MADDLRLVWIDLEMTGLDPSVDVIVEIACIVTDADLNPLGECNHVVWQPDEALARMTPFVRDMHTKNGLLDRVRESKTDLAGAEREVLKLVSEHCALGKGVLAGNSIHMDRLFLRAYMPQLEGFLHYRQVDVSSIKVLASSWYPDLGKFTKEAKDHTALSDIRRSIQELQHYRTNIFQ